MTNRAKGWLFATIVSAGIWTVAAFLAYGAVGSSPQTLSADYQGSDGARPFIETEPA